jgi:hypothetical protein
MIWKSFVDVARDVVHVMPVTNPPHEYSDCWCDPVEAILEENRVLVSHRLEDGSCD